MRRRLAAERGYTLIELLIVIAILGFIMAGIANLLVSGSRAQSDTSARVAAQGSTRTALDRLEFEARCASNATILNSGAGVALTLPTQCPHATGNVTWCVSGGVLTRYSGTLTCSGGTSYPYVSSITTPTPFSIVWGTSNLPQLAVTLAVNTTNRSSDAFTLKDSIALRNQVISLGDPSPVSGAVGSTVTITGTNFKPNSALSVTFGQVPATITSGGTSSNLGAVSVTFTVPFSGNGAFSVSVGDGTNTATSATKYTVSGSFDGFGLTSVTHSGGGLMTCSTVSANTTCSIPSLGNTGNVAGKPTLETVAAVNVTNTGSAATVSQSVTNEVNPGATATPSTTTINTGSAATASTFTMTGNGSGWISNMKATTTINGVSYSITIQGVG
jgi:prepilin-type N-terminal cleavage/methylation domain-containing protein